MAIITYADVRAALGLAASDCPPDAALLSAYAAAASRAAESYCRREFALAERTEDLTGGGGPLLALPAFPVASVASVRVDPSRRFGAGTALAEDSDYVLDARAGHLHLLRAPASSGYAAFASGAPWHAAAGATWGGLTLRGRGRPAWSTSPLSVRVTYTAGYERAPDDVRQAAAQIACWMYANTATGGMVAGSVSYIDVSTSVQSAVDSLASGAVPSLGSARSLLAPYRRLVI